MTAKVLFCILLAVSLIFFHSEAESWKNRCCANVMVVRSGFLLYHHTSSYTSTDHMFLTAKASHALWIQSTAALTLMEEPEPVWSYGTFLGSLDVFYIDDETHWPPSLIVLNILKSFLMYLHPSSVIPEHVLACLCARKKSHTINKAAGCNTKPPRHFV